MGKRRNPFGEGGGGDRAERDKTPPPKPNPKAAREAQDALKADPELNRSVGKGLRKDTASPHLPGVQIEDGRPAQAQIADLEGHPKAKQVGTDFDPAKIARVSKELDDRSAQAQGADIEGHPKAKQVGGAFNFPAIQRASRELEQRRNPPASPPPSAPPPPRKNP